MVLAATAGPLDRARLHDRYASVWRTEDNEGPNPADQFHAVRKSVDDFGWTAGPLGHLARAVAYANISAAARRLWDRDADGAAQRLEPLPGNIASIAAYAPPRRPSAASDNTEWARGFLALGTAVEPRSAMLDRFPARVNAVSPANAQVLVDAALRGSPVKIRQQAASIVSQLDGDTQIMLAMLEALPSAPKVRSSGELFGVFTLVDSGAVRGAAWQENVRAALITRINDNLAGAGESGVIDALADALAAAYADELGILPTPGEERDHAAAALWRAWAAIAPATARPMLGSAITMDEIERTRLARLAVAEGPGQRFLAEQIATVEAMASVTMQESPNAAPRVLQMIERLHTALMSGDQLFEQIAKTEAARLDLWLLRFEKRR
jgi:hypothetical protein